MTIYRDPGGRLVVFNGIAVRSDALESILELGTPSVLVVPSGCHRCCAGVWKRKFPKMKVVCPESVIKTVEEELSVDSSIQAWVEEESWSPFVQAKMIDGWSDFETVLEVVLEFGNKEEPKKAMLVCDLLFTMPFSMSKASFMDKLMNWIFDSGIPDPAEDENKMPSSFPRCLESLDWLRSEIGWQRSDGSDDTQARASRLSVSDTGFRSFQNPQKAAGLRYSACAIN